MTESADENVAGSTGMTMKEITIRMAGRTVAVNAMNESTCEFLRGYQWENTADFSVEISPEDIGLI
jgi:hypothetical protein